MKQWQASNGVRVVQVLAGRSNAYLVISDRNTILVDTGKRVTFSKLNSRMVELGCPIENIDYLMLTHTHFDHCQSAKAIQLISGCKVVTSTKAEESALKGYTQLPKGTLVTTRVIAKIGQKIGKHGFGYEPFQPDLTVEESLNIDVDGSTIHIFHTPGHSADSLSILINNEIAIVGDTMFGVLRHSIFPPYADDPTLLINSWQALLETGCKLFLPGHGRAISRQLLQQEVIKYSKKPRR